MHKSRNRFLKPILFYDSMYARKWYSILTVFLIGSISISFVYIQNENFGLSAVLASSSAANATNIVAEGNSTFSNSTQDNDQGISKIIVIPNPNSDTSSDNSPSDNNNNNSQGDGLTSNNTITPSPQNNESSLESEDALNTLQTSSNNSSMQRGEYKVDNNGIHYYDINNCSLVKGSSGIGDLSECEDAEREIQEELTG